MSDISHNPGRKDLNYTRDQDHKTKIGDQSQISSIWMAVMVSNFNQSDAWDLRLVSSFSLMILGLDSTDIFLHRLYNSMWLSFVWPLYIIFIFIYNKYDWSVWLCNGSVAMPWTVFHLEVVVGFLSAAMVVSLLKSVRTSQREKLSLYSIDTPLLHGPKV